MVPCDGQKLNLRPSELVALGDLVRRGLVEFSGCEVIFNVNGAKVHVPISEVMASNGGLAAIRKAILHGWLFRDDRWSKDGVSFVHMHEEILGTFDDEEYSFLEVNNRPVIDVGAYIGDTALYFVKKGASKVIAVEPSPGAFKELTDDIIKINGAQAKVVAVNAAIAEAGPVPISKDAADVKGARVRWVGRSKVERKDDTLTSVKAMGLYEVVKLYGVDNAALKADCEGCEYHIAMREPEALSGFEEIGLEYHAFNSGIPVSELIRALSNAGFVCERANDWVYLKNAGSSWNSEMIGMLHCVRRR
ncbi:methyltransferase FkbM family [Acidilobus saccharovorans 345-15]|uniref:Methyltransferase FkbM family n=1 Tax=Acidilobus saccharovorans (strain DSM 16705 / JCM 18335 / VKM B-2471 / 345-15) TaxID=666510 RepID=D9Q183_ACIS3|nr:FkbM family methyltransferase [Acidilobus saccharovorans]ADL19071.1 methyltransferase FkbM family [Acidilobus saccharovorans 345-15]